MRFSEFQNSNVAMWGIYVRRRGSVYAHTNAVDGNKNVSEVLDESGNIVAHYEYAAFGDAVIVSGEKALANPFRFSSEYADDALGLTYYNYRHLDHAAGRWLSRDPIEEQGGWNLYGLCGNCVLNTIDALGTMKVGLVGITQNIGLESSQSTLWIGAYFKFNSETENGIITIRRHLELNLCHCSKEGIGVNTNQSIVSYMNIKNGVDVSTDKRYFFTDRKSHPYFEICSLENYSTYSGEIQFDYSISYSHNTSYLEKDGRAIDASIFTPHEKDRKVRSYRDNGKKVNYMKQVSAHIKIKCKCGTGCEVTEFFKRGTDWIESGRLFNRIDQYGVSRVKKDAKEW